jgi:hypothetical protein
MSTVVPNEYANIVITGEVHGTNSLFLDSEVTA